MRIGAFRKTARALTIGALAAASLAAQEGYSLADGQAFLAAYCQACHQGKSGAAGFHIEDVQTVESFEAQAVRWGKIVARVANGEMPPMGAPAPELDARERFTQWANESLHTAACAMGITAGRRSLRRLNRDEYAATIRDLFDLQIDVADLLPVDGAGGEGFDNAAETLFLSPLHSEKYIEVAKLTVDFASKEFKSRQKIFVAEPGPGKTPEQAATEILTSFLPRAYRRPVDQSEVESYVQLFDAAVKQGNDFEPAILFAIRSVLVSPRFLFHYEPPNNSSEEQLLDQYSIANRLSYFLWGGMPDELLTDIAAKGRLHDPEVVKPLIQVMLRNDRALTFAERFVEQWLRTRQLEDDKAPDAELFPSYQVDEELRSDIRLQPVFFFQHVFKENLSLLNFLDSDSTIITGTLAKHFGLKFELEQSKDPRWMELPPDSNRGGLLGMPAVLAVSSYPYRTSPVLRGAWVLDSILGTPPPPPPPNVPALEQTKRAKPSTVRELLTQHRENPVCASCHARIDPLGFALENYDSIGRWRDNQGGTDLDSSAELMDGTSFHGPDGLRAELLERKDLFIRNLTRKMLGYALGRGLTLRDSCTVDEIVAKVKQNDYSALTLIEEVALSTPFLYQQGSVPEATP
jgi:hypothetical protein